MFHLLLKHVLDEILFTVLKLNIPTTLFASRQADGMFGPYKVYMTNWIIVCFMSPENHILEDVNKCVIALQEKDVDGLDRTAGAIRGRAARVVHVVTSEMDNYEPGVYTEKVLEATKLLTNTGTTENKILRWAKE